MTRQTAPGDEDGSAFGVPDPGPQTIEDFRLIERIGEGGAAVVYRAVHRSIGIDVALKVWRERLTATRREQFLQECRAQWEFSGHPNIVRLYWAGAPDDGPPWLATELLTQSLADRLLAEPPLTRQEAVGIAEDLLSGLAALHRRGMLHRDVTPANVLLGARGAALGDFGIVMPMTGRTRDAAAGTDVYVAPEVAAGAMPSPRTDVYSAAVTIRRMFDDVPAPVDAVLTRAASHRPQDRPEHAGALLELLRSAASGEAALRCAAPPHGEPGVGHAVGASGSPTRRRPRRRLTRSSGTAVSRRTRRLGLPPTRPWIAGWAPRWLIPAAVLTVVAAAAIGRFPDVAGAADDAAGQTAQPAARLAVPDGVVLKPADRTVDVRWSTVGGGAVDGYLVTAEPEDSRLPPARCTSSPGAGSCRLTDLTNGVTYGVSVTATSGTRVGPQSPAVAVIPYPARLMTGRSLALWLDGADPASMVASSNCAGALSREAVGCWKDKSGRANDATQPTAAERPGLIEVGSRRIPGFDGNDDSLWLARPRALPAGDTPSTTFVTAVQSDPAPTSSAWRVALFWGSVQSFGSAREVYKDTGSRAAAVGVYGRGARVGDWPAGPAVIAGEHTSSLVAGRIDGKAPVSVPVDADTGREVGQIGRQPFGFFWQGSIHEIIVFGRILDDAERRSVEEYLSRKWGAGVAP